MGCRRVRTTSAISLASTDLSTISNWIVWPGALFHFCSGQPPHAAAISMAVALHNTRFGIIVLSHNVMRIRCSHRRFGQMPLALVVAFLALERVLVAQA